MTSEPVHSSAKELLRLHRSVQDGNPRTLLSVCGPFTTADNLEYEPLFDLLEVNPTESCRPSLDDATAECLLWAFLP